MSFVATSNVPSQRSITAGGSDLARGVRVTLGAAGTCTVSAIGVRGDFITLEAIPAAARGLAAPVNVGGSLPVVATEITAVGDAAYSAAIGKVSKTAGGGAVLMGKWLQVATADGLAVMELAPIA